MFDRLARRPRLWNALVACITLLGAAWTAASALPQPDAVSRPPSPQRGFPAPPFSLSSLDGSLVRISDYSGHVVVINFWASWCPPCRSEMPALQSAYEADAADGLVVLGINAANQDSRAEALAMVERLGLTFPILFDNQGQASRLYRIQALPSTFILDRQATVRSVILGGPLSPAALESEVRPLLMESD